jgi:hypothetical protein
LYKEKEMNSELNNGRNAVAGPVSILALAVAGMLSAGSALAATLNGQVLGGRRAGCQFDDNTLGCQCRRTETTGAGAKSGADGRFTLNARRRRPGPTSLYLIAQGGQPTANKAAGNNPAIALMTVLGQQAAGQGHDQRDDDRRLGVDPQPVHQRHERSRPSRCN